jgi:hypothetical protein
MNNFIKFYALAVLIFTSHIFSQDEEKTWWSNAVKESQKFIDKSSESISIALNSMMQEIDKELAYFKKDDTGEVDIQKKINGIRDYLDEYSEIKGKDQTNSCVQGIFKSRVDCRILIDEVLYEIEEIVFDGQIISYSEKIRNIRLDIKDLEVKKSQLNEDFVFAKDKEKTSKFESSKEDIAEDLENVSMLINKNNTLIENLEYDLQKKMLNLGIELTLEQIEILTTRVDGDDLAKSIAIFDVTKQITNSLEELMKQNSFNGESTARYYGIYVILSEILGFAQREYISKLDEIYLKRINEIKNNSYKSISMAENKMAESQFEQSIEIYKNNIEAEKFTIKAANAYREILIDQRSKLLIALKTTEEQISVGYSSYTTASNSSILSTLIQDTQSSFDHIMSMQIPDIVPFENSSLQSEFNKLSGKINTN